MGTPTSSMDSTQLHGSCCSCLHILVLFGSEGQLASKKPTNDVPRLVPGSCSAHTPSPKIPQDFPSPRMFPKKTTTVGEGTTCLDPHHLSGPTPRRAPFPPAFLRPRKRISPWSAQRRRRAVPGAETQSSSHSFVGSGKLSSGWGACFG